MKLWKDRLCRRSTNEILYFDIIITLRVENIHRVLKSKLKFSTSDLIHVINNIENLLINMLKNYWTKLNKIKRNVSFNLQRSIFWNLIDRVISHIIWTIHDQYERFQKVIVAKSLSLYIKIFTKIIRLSYSHQVQARMKENENFNHIFVEDVHNHWRFKKSNNDCVITAEFVFNFSAID